MTQRDRKGKVLVEQKIGDSFQFQSGVRQGDSLFALLFHLIMQDFFEKKVDNNK